MNYVKLGSAGLKVSRICLGMMSYGSQAERAWHLDEAAAEPIVKAAVDGGITFFDTADTYSGGVTEEISGRLLGRLFDRREDYVLATKVYFPMGPGPNDRGLSRKHVLSSIDASLRRLGTDYVDLYQAHRYDHETPLEETMRAFDDLVRQGKVLYIGVSEWRAEEISAALGIAGQMGLDRIISNQPQYNMLWRVIEAEVLPLCVKEGIGQIVWSPIAQGALSGKYLPGQDAPAGSRATDASGSGFIRGFLNDAILSRVAELRPVAEQAGLSMAQLAIAWVLQNPGVSAAIIGATRPEQVRENVKASGVQLDADIMRKIDDVLGPVIERDPTRTISPPARP